MVCLSTNLTRVRQEVMVTVTVTCLLTLGHPTRVLWGMVMETGMCLLTEGQRTLVWQTGAMRATEMEMATATATGSLARARSRRFVQIAMATPTLIATK